jgi:putative DNA methylase
VLQKLALEADYFERNAHRMRYPEFRKQGLFVGSADPFCGSGQIPFEAARIGCDVLASDLNPIACMLTWGAFNIIGGSKDSARSLVNRQQELKDRLQSEIDALKIETDGSGWRGKVYLHSAEAMCPQSGWMVPLLPSRVVSTSRSAIAELIPDPTNKRYEILIVRGVSPKQMAEAEIGTIVRDEKFGEGQLTHWVDGTRYKSRISTIRGDYLLPSGEIRNRLRTWEKHDFVPRGEDIIQERLYAVQWMNQRMPGKERTTNSELSQTKI